VCNLQVDCLESSVKSAAHIAARTHFGSLMVMMALSPFFIFISARSTPSGTWVIGVGLFKFEVGCLDVASYGLECSEFGGAKRQHSTRSHQITPDHNIRCAPSHRPPPPPPHRPPQPHQTRCRRGGWRGTWGDGDGCDLDAATRWLACWQGEKGTAACLKANSKKPKGFRCCYQTLLMPHHHVTRTATTHPRNHRPGPKPHRPLTPT